MYCTSRCGPPLDIITLSNATCGHQGCSRTQVPTTPWREGAVLLLPLPPPPSPPPSTMAPPHTTQPLAPYRARISTGHLALQHPHTPRQQSSTQPSHRTLQTQTRMTPTFKSSSTMHLPPSLCSRLRHSCRSLP